MSHVTVLCCWEKVAGRRLQHSSHTRTHVTWIQRRSVFSPFAPHVSLQSITAQVRVELQCDVAVGGSWTAVEEAIGKISGTKVLRVDPATQCVSIELSEGAAVGIDELQNFIETSAGLKTVLKGLGTEAAAVSEIRGTNDIVGVVRMAQLPERTCFVDGVIDKIPDEKLSLNVHEFGDLSGSCYDNIGKPILNLNPELRQNGAGYSSFRLQIPDCDVQSCIGRAMAVTAQPENKVLAAGIVARSSTVGHNLAKKVCDCSGKSMWEERTESKMQRRVCLHVNAND